MDILVGGERSLKTLHGCYRDMFLETAPKCQSIAISSGYFGTDSVIFLLDNIENGSLPPIDLTVGMAAFDGITRGQYQALSNLSEHLVSLGHKGVMISNEFPFHGKVTTFISDDRPFYGSVGSSNATVLVPEIPRQVEIDIGISDTAVLQGLLDIQRQVEGQSISFSSWDPGSFRNQQQHMLAYPYVDKATSSEMALFDKGPSIVYQLPIKATEKSNLNCFFGKGRETTRTGVIRPRHWYEVELIVPKEITSTADYPYHSEFKVVTDDGLSFQCKTQGDYSKNLRSTGDLTVLGSWLKGRLEEAGALKVGDPVLTSTMDTYGRDTLDLIATEQPDVFLMDFSVPRVARDLS